MKTPDKPPASGYWQVRYNRLERKAAWLFLIAGFGILAGYGLLSFARELFRVMRQFVSHPTVALFLSLAGFFATLGLLLLVISVVREKLYARHYDPYAKEEK